MRQGKEPARLGRRACLAVAVGGLAGAATESRAADRATIRLGILQFGTVQWVAEIIRRHALDATNAIALETVVLANNDAGRVALMAGAADVIVSDWFFVASQREAGTRLRFAPFSSAAGGVMVRPDSPLRGLADLAGARLGVAGGPVDKSWLVVQAAARGAENLDLARTAAVVYGAPPLLNAKLLQGELDAVLTFWNFAARLEAAGCRELVSVAECAHRLGLPDHLSLIGFVFHEDWARQRPAAIDGLLAAVAAAEARLVSSPDEWQPIRPLMEAPDDALFASLRRRFIDGVAHLDAPAQEQAAQRLFEILVRTGGSRATSGMERLPEGIFWPSGHG